MRIFYINGCLYNFEPTENFENIEQNKKLKFQFEVKYFAVARTDIMPNWFITGKGLQAKAIISTAGEHLTFVGPFDTKAKWKRYINDQYNPFTPGQRYDINDVKDLSRAPLKVN